MIGKLFRQTLTNSLTKQTGRLREAKAFVCVYEDKSKAAVEQSTKALKEHQAKYELSPERMTTIFPFLVIDKPKLREILKPSDYDEYIHQMESKWIQSSYYDPKLTFDQFLEAAQRKYPDLINYSKDHYTTERKEALEILATLFYADEQEAVQAQKSPNLWEKDPKKLLDITERKIFDFVQKLRQDKSLNQKWVDHVQASLIDVKAAVDQSTLNEGLLHYYLWKSGIIEPAPFVLSKRLEAAKERAAHRLQVIEREMTSEGRNLEDAYKKLQASASESQAVINRALEEGNTIPAFVHESSKDLRGSLHYHNLPWQDNKKIILEAIAEEESVWCWYVLAGAVGSYWLCSLWGGDAHTATLFVTPLLAGALYARGHINAARNKLQYLVQINLHKGGKNLDLFLQRPSKPIQKVEGVPIGDFKVHRGDYAFAKDSGVEIPVFRKGPAIDATLSGLRRYATGNDAYLVTYGTGHAFIPNNYTGNSSIVRNVFEGKEVNLA
jgi:hypothetical protein